MTDTFLQPVVADFPRTERYKQPLVVPPGGGPLVPYGRPSSWGKKIEDTFGLELWQRRMVVVGMSRTPSLVARACAITADPKAWTKEDKKALNAIAEDAQTAAKSNQAADIGTALHRMTERLDRGETLSDLPEPFASDLAAYREGMRAHGLVTRPDRVECKLVCDELKLAGSADRICGPHVFDLKTGESIEAAALGFAVQLAIYAHSCLYDVATGARTPLDLNTDVAYVGHLPAGSGTFTLYEVDIAAGWEAALLAADIDRWRKRKGLLKVVTKPVQSAPVARIVAASAPTGLDGDIANGTATLTPAEQLARVPKKPDEGGPGDDESFGVIEKRYMALAQDARAWVNAIAEQATHAGVSFHSKSNRTVRRFELLRALITLAEVDPDDDTVRALAANVIGDVANFPAVKLGHAVGAMDADEAARFAQLADALVAGTVAGRVTDDGALVFEITTS